MIVSEKGAVKALNEAYKKGYEIVPAVRQIAIYTEEWALETFTNELPLEVSQKLVEHYGGIQVEAQFVQKGRSAQLMMQAEVSDRLEELQDATEQSRVLHRVPITFRGRWDLFVTTEGEIYGFDQKHLTVVQEFADPYVSDNGMGIFAMGEERMIIAPAKFGAEDRRKLNAIAELWKTPRVELVEAPENLCLFDDMGRE